MNNNVDVEPEKIGAAPREVVEICGCGQPIIADHWQAQCDECYQNFNRSSKSIKDQLDEMDRARPRWVD